MRRPLRHISIGILFISSSVPLQAADETAILQNGGSWTDDSIWSTSLFPDNGNGDLTYAADVQSYTVTIPSLTDIQLDELLLSSGRIDGEASKLLIDDSAIWSGGWLSGGDGGLEIGGLGTWRVEGAGSHYFSGTLLNSGSVIVESTIHSRDAGSVFNNSGVIDIQADILALQRGSDSSFVNLVGGILRRSAATGIASTTLPIDNRGLIDVQSGSLRLQAISSSSGVIQVDAGAILDIAADFRFDQLASSTGDGWIRQSGATTTIAGATSLVKYELASGILQGGGGVLTVGNELLWTGGRIDGLQLSEASHTTIRIANSSTFSGAIQHAGLLVWEEGVVYSKVSGSSFNNTGLMDFRGSGLSFSQSDPATLVNLSGGTLRRSGNAGVATIGLPVDNRGIIEVQSGELWLQGGGKSTAEISVSEGAMLQIRGDFEFNAGATSTGDGWIRQSGATTTIAGDTSLVKYELASGILQGGGGVLTVGNELLWTGGRIDGLTLGAGTSTSIDGPASKMFSGRFENYGTIHWNGGSVSGRLPDPVLVNRGELNLRGDGAFFSEGYESILINDATATINRYNSDGVAYIYGGLRNHGLVQVAQGALYIRDLQANTGTLRAEHFDSKIILLGGVATEGTFTAANQGTIDFNSGLSSIGRAALVQLDGVGSHITGLTDTGGTFEWNFGRLEVINGAAAYFSNKDDYEANNRGEIYVGEGSSILDGIVNSGLLHGAGSFSTVIGTGGVVRGEPLLDVGGYIGRSGTNEMQGHIRVSGARVFEGELLVGEASTLEVTGTALNLGYEIDPQGTIVDPDSARSLNFDGTIAGNVDAWASNITGSGDIGGSLQLTGAIIDATDRIDVAGDFRTAGRGYTLIDGTPTTSYAASVLSNGTLSIGGDANLGTSFELASGTELIVDGGLIRVEHSPSSSGTSSFALRGDGTVRGPAAGPLTLIGQASDVTFSGELVVSDGTLLSTRVLGNVVTRGSSELGGLALRIGGSLAVESGSTTIGYYSPFTVGLHAQSVSVAPGAKLRLYQTSIPAGQMIDAIGGMVEVHDRVIGPGGIEGTTTLDYGTLDNITIQGDVVSRGESFLDGSAVAIAGDLNIEDGTLELQENTSLDFTGSRIGIGEGATLDLRSSFSLAASQRIDSEGVVKVASGTVLSGGATVGGLTQVDGEVRGMKLHDLELDGGLMNGGSAGSVQANGVARLQGADLRAGTLTVRSFAHVTLEEDSHLTLTDQLTVGYRGVFSLSEGATVEVPRLVVGPEGSAVVDKGFSGEVLHFYTGKVWTRNPDGTFTKYVISNESGSHQFEYGPAADGSVSKWKSAFDTFTRDGCDGIHDCDDTGGIDFQPTMSGIDLTLSIGTLDIKDGYVDGDLGDLGKLEIGSVKGSPDVRLPATINTLMLPGTLAIDPGNSPGVVEFSASSDSALTLKLDERGTGSAATMHFEINDALGTAGGTTGWDLVSAPAGGVSFDTADGNDFTLQVDSLGWDDLAGAMANFDPHASYTWRFVDTASGFFGTPFEQINFIIDDIQFAFENGVVPGSFTVVQDSPTSLALQYDFVGFVLHGDFNMDGTVDGADFLAWQQDPKVGDLSHWQANYGASASATVMKVPEPSTFVLICSSLGLAMWRRQFRGLRTDEL